MRFTCGSRGLGLQMGSFKLRFSFGFLGLGLQMGSFRVDLSFGFPGLGLRMGSFRARLSFGFRGLGLEMGSFRVRLSLGFLGLGLQMGSVRVRSSQLQGEVLHWQLQLQTWRAGQLPASLPRFKAAFDPVLELSGPRSEGVQHLQVQKGSKAAVCIAVARMSQGQMRDRASDARCYEKGAQGGDQQLEMLCEISSSGA